MEILTSGSAAQLTGCRGGSRMVRFFILMMHLRLQWKFISVHYLSIVWCWWGHFLEMDERDLISSIRADDLTWKNSIDNYAARKRVLIKNEKLKRILWMWFLTSHRGRNYNVKFETTHLNSRITGEKNWKLSANIDRSDESN